MKIHVRKRSAHYDVKIEDGATTIDLGLMNETEKAEFAKLLNRAIYELDESPEFQDYDPEILNDFGDGNVDWWLDYLRSEINRCNEFWREQTQ